LVTDETKAAGDAVLGIRVGMTANAVVLAALPGLDPEQAKDFYKRALESLPTTRIRGFFGVTDGSSERADDAVLLM
jgi:hypothetical protein